MNDQTLRLWSAKSLDERVVLFKQKYPYAHITIYKLRKFYRDNKIKKKSIRLTKIMLPRQLPNTYQDVLDLTEDIQSAVLQGYRIIQLDEMMITKRTFPKQDWSKLRQNTSFDYAQTDTKAVAVVGAVSREKGVELIMTWPKSVNVMKFKVFLDELRRLNPFDNIILMMDNLAVHRSNHTKERMEELGYRYTWTPRYSPQYNGIEEVWNMSKQYIKK